MLWVLKRTVLGAQKNYLIEPVLGVPTTYFGLEIKEKYVFVTLKTKAHTSLTYYFLSPNIALVIFIQIEGNSITENEI